jgi:leader peptidase (prepilin peptidase)/N-methyltransferase
MNAAALNALALPAVLTLIVGVLGLAIGSFLNVVVWRLPRGGSLVSPPSACPGCGHAIRARDNVPVLSWLLLRGKCRDCRTAIAKRYPLVEGGTALAFVAIAVYLGSSAGLFSTSLAPFGGQPLSSLAVLPALLYLAAISIALGLIDADTHTLPNRIVLPAYLVGAALLALASAASADWMALLWAAVGAGAMWLFYLVLALARPGGMGFGDVKLAGVLGLYLGWFGWGPLIVGLFAAFVLGGVYSIGLLITRRAGRRSGIPFGPWMLAGAWVGIFVGAPIADAYLHFTGLG